MKFFFSPFFILFFLTLKAQPQQRDFLKYQMSFQKISDAFANQEDSLKSQFEAKGLVWPAKYLYIRSFKYDSQLEVWVKNAKAEKYKLFKTYKICALAGNLGPKRFEGDFQVPEGFYHINEFRPNSKFHMALGVNYPNASDRILSDSVRPGGDIYIHGSCMTVGCIPITDEPVEELYVLAALTHDAGEDFIPIHVFPVKFKIEKSREVLDKYLLTHPGYEPMVKKMMKIYFYFNQYKQLPTIWINSKGEYEMAEEYTYTIPKKVEIKEKVQVENLVRRKTATKVENFTENDFYPSVFKMPVYPGGIMAFQGFLEKLSADLAPYLPEEKIRIFAHVDFVVDKEGNLVNVKVSDNANNEINNLIIDRFEAMPKWSPAIRQEPVAIRLQQSIMVEAIIKPKPPPAPKKGEYEDD